MVIIICKTKNDEHKNPTGYTVCSKKYLYILNVSRDKKSVINTLFKMKSK